MGRVDVHRDFLTCIDREAHFALKVSSTSRVQLVKCKYASVFSLRGFVVPNLRLQLDILYILQIYNAVNKVQEIIYNISQSTGRAVKTAKRVYVIDTSEVEMREVI